MIEKSKIPEYYAELINLKLFQHDKNGKIDINVFMGILTFEQQKQFLAYFEYYKKLTILDKYSNPIEGLRDTGTLVQPIYIPLNGKIRSSNMLIYDKYVSSMNLEDFAQWESSTKYLSGLPGSDNRFINVINSIYDILFFHDLQGKISELDLEKLMARKQGEIIERHMLQALNQISESSDGVIKITTQPLGKQNLFSLPGNSLIPVLCQISQITEPFSPIQPVYFEDGRKIILMCLPPEVICNTRIVINGKEYCTIFGDQKDSDELYSIVSSYIMRLFLKEGKKVTRQEYNPLINALSNTEHKSIFNPKNKCRQLGDFDFEAISLASGRYMQTFGDRVIKKNITESICQAPNPQEIFKISAKFCTPIEIYFGNPEEQVHGCDNLLNYKEFIQSQISKIPTEVKTDVKVVQPNNITTQNAQKNYFGSNILYNFVLGFISSAMHSIVDNKFAQMTDANRKMIKIVTDFPLNYMAMGPNYAYVSAGATILSISNSKIALAFQTISFIATLYNEEDKATKCIEIASFHFGSFVFSKFCKPYIKQRYWVDNVASQGSAPAQNVQNIGNTIIL